MSSDELVNAYRGKTECLTYRDDSWLTVDEWERLMVRACPGGYNNFEAIIVADASRAMLDDDTSCIAMQAARESSVACYICSTTENLDVLLKIKKLRRALLADEAHIVSNSEQLRLWWN